MFRKQYKVKGEDVSDFMVMEDFAYSLYCITHVKAFLIEKGYSKNKLEDLKLVLKNCKEELISKKHLIFTQGFFMNLDDFTLNNDKQKITIKTRFFNTNNELCAMLTISS